MSFHLFTSVLFYCFLIKVNSSTNKNHLNINDEFNLSSPYLESMYTKENVKLWGNDLIPSSSFDNHKGQMGRVCIIGGSLQYTGAAYYAAISSLKSGADLVYMICCEGAVPILKSYSPEIIVLPHYLDKQGSVDGILQWMDRMHSILIGPGLGTDPLVQQNVVSIIENLISRNTTIPIVVDADGLRLLVNNKELLLNSKSQIYLTPNERERSLLFPNDGSGSIGQPDKLTIVKKGAEDQIVSILKKENITVSCDEKNSWRRCGGQGDLVAGTLATFAHYANLKKQQSANDTKLIRWDVVASFAACSIVRKTNLLAFQLKKRSMLVTDMIEHLHVALGNYFKNW